MNKGCMEAGTQQHELHCSRSTWLWSRTEGLVCQEQDWVPRTTFPRVTSLAGWLAWPLPSGTGCCVLIRCKLLYRGWINNTVLLYSMGDHIHYPVMNIMENRILKKAGKKKRYLMDTDCVPAYNASVDVQNSLSLIVIFQTELLDQENHYSKWSAAMGSACGIHSRLCHVPHLPRAGPAVK